MSTNAVAVANSAIGVTRIDDHAAQDARDQFILDNYCSGAPKEIAATFVALCRRRNLAPEENQICLTNRGGKWVMQTTIDGYRVIAERTERYAGSDEPIYDVEDAQHPNKATVTVWKMVEGQRCAFTGTARWSEYRPEGKAGFMWDRMPYLMLAKCSEAQALRKGFPADLSGTYIDAEMDQAESVIETRGRVIDRAAGEIPESATKQRPKDVGEEIANSWLMAIRDAQTPEELERHRETIAAQRQGTDVVWAAYHQRKRTLTQAAPTEGGTAAEPITPRQMAALHARIAEILGRDGHALLHWIAVAQYGLASVTEMTREQANDVAAWLRTTHPDEIRRRAAEIEASDQDDDAPTEIDEGEAALIAFRERCEAAAAPADVRAMYDAAGTDEAHWVTIMQTRQFPADVSEAIATAKRAKCFFQGVSEAANERAAFLRKRAEDKTR